MAGVVYDPERDELFSAAKDSPATLNNQLIRVSSRTDMGDAIMAIGFFKSAETIRRSLHDFQHLINRIRKVRLMGAAALDCAYVASGRYDAYIEYGIKLWDIAAGQFILDRAGGKTVSHPTSDPHTFDIKMWNGQMNIELPEHR